MSTNIVELSPLAIFNVESDHLGQKFGYDYAPIQIKELKPLNDIFYSISKNSNIEKDTGILPPGVKFITKEFIVYERQPEFKNIFIIPKLMNDIQEYDSPESYLIPIPWQLYIIQYSSVTNENGTVDYYPANVKLHFMKDSLSFLEQEVYLAPLPNFYTDGSLCRPFFSSMEEIERYSKDISGVIKAAYDWIWNCGTNLDLTESCLQMFIQLNDLNIENTIFHPSHTEFIERYKFGAGFYASHNHISYLMRAWEKNSLLDVCNKEWPSNYIEKNFFRERVRILTSPSFADFIENHCRSELYYELHCDDDDTEYQCDESSFEDGDYCSCRIPSNYFHWNDYFRYINDGKSRPKPLTFIESFKSFVVGYSQNFHNLSKIFTDAQAANMIRSIENKIMLAS